MSEPKRMGPDPAVTREKSNWYFTFMFKQEHRNRYVKFYDTYMGARESMQMAFGDQWAFQYSEEDFEGQAEQYHLTELK